MSAASDAAALAATYPRDSEIGQLARARLELALDEQRTSAMTIIKSPNPKATNRSDFGPITLAFVDGVATYDGDLPDGLRAYLVSAGYGINGKPATLEPTPALMDDQGRDFDGRDAPAVVEMNNFQGVEASPPVTDGRSIDGHFVSDAQLRDAAVDPQPGDFNPPIGAGEADPHSPAVRSIEVGTPEFDQVVYAMRAERGDDGWPAPTDTNGDAA